MRQAFTRLGLYTSRDGVRWNRSCGDGGWVSGGEPGSADYGMMCFCAGGEPLVHNGQMVIPCKAAVRARCWTSLSSTERCCGRADNATPIKQEQLTSALPGDFSSKPLASGADFYADQKKWWDERTQLLGFAGETADWSQNWHKRSVGGLILREDGWAKLAPAYEHGRVVTKQFLFDGSALRVNADCKFGYLKVEVLDTELEAYPGFGEDECEPVHDPDPGRIWHDVSWRGGEVSSLQGKPVRLVFHLHEASLYSFQFVQA